MISLKHSYNTVHLPHLFYEVPSQNKKPYRYFTFVIRSWIKAFKNESCPTFKMTKRENKFATVSFAG